MLDFTQVLAGPTVTRLMAEMGADIIKVEMAPNGEISRALPFMKDGRSGYFIQQNRGKKSLCVDVRHPKGQEILKDLIKQVDVVVENFSPGDCMIRSVRMLFGEPNPGDHVFDFGIVATDH